MANKIPMGSWGSLWLSKILTLVTVAVQHSRAVIQWLSRVTQACKRPLVGAAAQKWRPAGGMCLHAQVSARCNFHTTASLAVSCSPALVAATIKPVTLGVTLSKSDIKSILQRLSHV